MLDEKLARNQKHYFFLFCYFCVAAKPIQHSIQHGIFVMVDEMFDRFNKAIRKFFNIRSKKNPRRNLSWSKAASLQPDTLLKETLAHFFSWDFRDTFKNTFYVELYRLTASIQSLSWNFKKQTLFKGGFYQAVHFCNRILIHQGL